MLRWWTEAFITAVIQSTRKMPYGIRYLARETLAAIRVSSLRFTHWHTSNETLIRANFLTHLTKRVPSASGASSSIGISIPRLCRHLSFLVFFLQLAKLLRAFEVPPKLLISSPALSMSVLAKILPRSPKCWHRSRAAPNSGMTCRVTFPLMIT